MNDFDCGRNAGAGRSQSSTTSPTVLSPPAPAKHAVIMKATLPSTADSTPRTTTSRRSARHPDSGMTQEEFNRRYKCVWMEVPNCEDFSTRCPGIAFRGGHYFLVESISVEDPSRPSGLSNRIIPLEVPLRPLEVLRILHDINANYYGDDSDTDFDRIAEMFHWLAANLVEKGGAR